MSLQDRQERAAKQAEIGRRSVTAMPKVMPVTLWPEPAIFMASGQVDLRAAAGAHWRDVNSLWHFGAIPNDDYTEWDPFYLYADPGIGGRPTLGTTVLGIAASQRRYEHRWNCPRAIGALTITGVTPETTPSVPAPGSSPPHPYPAPAGVVHFTGSMGQQGTFDLTSQTWSFAS